MRTNEIELNLLSWNSKAMFIHEIDPDVTFLQEIWEPKQMIIDLIQGLKIKNLRGDGYGGTLLASKLPNLNPTSNSIKLNDDTVITKFVLAGNRFLWLSSLYINHGTKKNVLNTMAELQRHIPESDWPYIILAGDWNVNLNDKDNKITEALNYVWKSMNLNIIRCGNSRIEREIDFVVWE